MMTVKQRYDGIQTILKTCGNEGCHFLTLCSIIEEYTDCPLDLIDAIRVAQSKGWFDSTFEGKDAIAFLNYYTGKKWTRSELLKRLPIKILDNQFTEVIHYNKNTGFKHYKRRGFDTLTSSVTVRDGVILGYYVYTVEE